jgi:hypothetical protein
MVDCIEVVDEVVVELHWWDIFRFIAGTILSYYSGVFIAKFVNFLHINFWASLGYFSLCLFLGGLALISVYIFYIFPDPVVNVGIFIWTLSFFRWGTYML